MVNKFSELLRKVRFTYNFSKLDLFELTERIRESVIIFKKGKRKVQGVPQSQTAALPRPQEEAETDKSKQAQIEQTYEKHKD